MPHTTISQLIQDQDATPPVKLNTLEKGGVLRTAIGVLTFTAGTVNQTYAFVRVPKRARISDIRATHAAMSSGSFKLGLFRPQDGIAVDDDVFSTAVNVASARTNDSIQDLPLAADRAKDIATLYSTAISTASATNDQEFDIVATVVTVAGSGGAMAIEVDYVLPE